MKVKRHTTGLSILLDWEECEKLKEFLSGVEWKSPIANELRSELDEIIGRNNDHEDDLN